MTAFLFMGMPALRRQRFVLLERPFGSNLDVMANRTGLLTALRSEVCKSFLPNAEAAAAFRIADWAFRIYWQER